VSAVLKLGSSFSIPQTDAGGLMTRGVSLFLIAIGAILKFADRSGSVVCRRVLRASADAGSAGGREPVAVTAGSGATSGSVAGPTHVGSDGGGQLYIENRTFDEIQIGERATLARTLSYEDIELFAAMPGDVNPAHVDEEYAHSEMFHKIIAHGMWGGLADLDSPRHQAPWPRHRLSHADAAFPPPRHRGGDDDRVGDRLREGSRTP
jgi:MaoC like domain